MLLSEIRTHVRTTVDLDSTELSDTYLDVLCREATYDLLSRARHWPDFQAAWTFNTVAGTQTYSIATAEPASTDTAEILTIIDSTSGGYALEFLRHEFAEATWRNSLLTSGVPTHWSVWNGSIYLWPKPDRIRTLNVRSYRKPKDWVADGASGTPDMDVRLHPAIALYCLKRVYEFQEDPAMAAQYDQLYETLVQAVMREIFRAEQKPLIFNRGVVIPSDSAWLRSLAAGIP